MRRKSEYELTRETEKIGRLPAEDEDHISVETSICPVGGTFSSSSSLDLGLGRPSFQENI